MNTELITYYRDRNNKPRGVFYAKNDGGKVYFGWSLCCKKDKFDKSMGKMIASHRAFNSHHKDPMVNMPMSMMDEFIKFNSRAIKYFKDAAVPEYEWV